MERYRVAAAVLLLAAVPADTSAQPAAAERRPLVLERVVRDRWLHDGQHPEFVAFQTNRSSTHILDTIAHFRPHSRLLQMRVGNTSAGYHLDPTNRLISAQVNLPSSQPLPYWDAAERAEGRRRALRGEGALLNLPGARFWEVPFVLPAAPLLPGMTWQDTLSFVADPGEGLLETLEGVWHGEVVGDTVIDGRRLPLVRTRADVRYRARDRENDYATEHGFEIERDVAGTIVGRVAIDAAAGVRAAGVDTTRLSGTATLISHPGYRVVAPVRYERERTWTLRDSTAWLAVNDSLNALRRGQRTGMLHLPVTELDERLRAGDPTTVDSLYATWRATLDPDRRASIEALLMRWTSGRENRIAAGRRLQELRREAGDSAGDITAELGVLTRRERLTLASLQRLLPYLDDPGQLWQLGVLPRFAYTELGYGMLRATPIIQPDPAQWQCEPAACDVIISLRETAADPRLRDIALIGAFARDPATWYDEVLQRAEAGSLTARKAVSMADGLGAWSHPMPDAGADWRAWLAWMGGSPRFHGQQWEAVRMYAARTGRDPVEPLLAQWPPVADSARLVIGTVLRGMGALAAASPGELADILMTGSPLDAQTAQQQVGDRIWSRGAQASVPLAIELLPPLLDALAARRDPPWRVLEGLSWPSGRVLSGSAYSYHGVTGVPIFVLDEDLPAAVIAGLPAPFRAISREDWDARPRRAGGILVTLRPPVVWGDFVGLRANWTALAPRTEDQAPGGYAGGSMLILLRTAEGWRVVASGGWIT